MFGSALNKAKPNDLDLVLVYDPSALPIQSVLEVRDLLVRLVWEDVGLPADVILLSYREENRMHFIAEQSASRVH